jgi:hypothetical protein
MKGNNQRADFRICEFDLSVCGFEVLFSTWASEGCAATFIERCSRKSADRDLDTPAEEQFITRIPIFKGHYEASFDT